MKSIRALLSHFLVLAGLIVFSWQQTSAQLVLTDKIPVDPQVKIGKLPNGLTYYIRRNNKPEKKVQ
ncbi:MAG TPA: hypothetical protein VFV08_01870, partial [Puia sp.]|nr:hypothetical protein [Puia sp.]